MHVGRERGGRKKSRLVVITWSLMYNIDFFKMSLNSMMWLFVVLMITNQICWQFENLWTAAKWTFKGTIFFLAGRFARIFLLLQDEIFCWCSNECRKGLKPLGVFKYFLGKYFKSVVCPLLAFSTPRWSKSVLLYARKPGNELHWVLL